MNLKSGNITLRALEPEDLEFLFHTENDTNLWEVSNTQTPFSKYILTQYINNAHQDIYVVKQLRLIIEYDNKTIGMIDLFDFNPQHKRAGIGILIQKEYQNKGFASIVLDLVIKYAFNILSIHQLFAYIATDNLNSISLFTKHGFDKIGVKKDWILVNNSYKDVDFYQLINDIK